MCLLHTENTRMDLCDAFFSIWFFFHFNVWVMCLMQSVMQSFHERPLNWFMYTRAAILVRNSTSAPHPVLLWSAMTTSRSRSPVSRKGESKRRAMARIAELEKQLADRDALVLDMRALAMDKLEIIADLRYRLKRRSSRHHWRPMWYCPICMRQKERGLIHARHIIATCMHMNMKFDDCWSHARHIMPHAHAPAGGIW